MLLHQVTQLCVSVDLGIRFHEQIIQPKTNHQGENAESTLLTDNYEQQNIFLYRSAIYLLKYRNEFNLDWSTPNGGKKTDFFNLFVSHEQSNRSSTEKGM